jgi:hypothetical protein
MDYGVKRVWYVFGGIRRQAEAMGGLISGASLWLEHDLKSSVGGGCLAVCMDVGIDKHDTTAPRQVSRNGAQVALSSTSMTWRRHAKYSFSSPPAGREVHSQRSTS